MKERFFPVRLDSNAARGRKREAQRIQRTWLLMMRAERTDALSAIRKRARRGAARRGVTSL